LVVGDVPDLSPEEADDAARFVVARHRAMPGVTRSGLRVVALAAEVLLSVRVRRPFRRVDAATQVSLASDLGRTGLPLLAELVRMVRSVGLARVYDRRFEQGRVVA
jgi:hypothetical protein